MNLALASALLVDRLIARFRPRAGRTTSILLGIPATKRLAFCSGRHGQRAGDVLERLSPVAGHHADRDQFIHLHAPELLNLTYAVMRTNVVVGHHAEVLLVQSLMTLIGAR